MLRNALEHLVPKLVDEYNIWVREISHIIHWCVIEIDTGKVISVLAESIVLLITLLYFQ